MGLLLLLVFILTMKNFRYTSLNQCIYESLGIKVRLPSKSSIGAEKPITDLHETHCQGEPLLVTTYHQKEAVGKC